MSNPANSRCLIRCRVKPHQKTVPLIPPNGVEFHSKPGGNDDIQVAFLQRRAALVGHFADATLWIRAAGLISLYASSTMKYWHEYRHDFFRISDRDPSGNT